jgi:hypothetical protein
VQSPEFDVRSARRQNAALASVADAPHWMGMVDDGAGTPREEAVMRRIVGSMLAAVVLCTSAARAAQSNAHILSAPETIGDQLVFFYDARGDFTTFLTIRNLSPNELVVSVLFFGPAFSTPFSKAVTLAGGALTIIDTGALRGNGLPAQAGLAFATAVDGAGRPITSGALTGNFTVANLSTGAAFGAPGAARTTLTDAGDVPPTGAVIDGDHAVLKIIRPDSALLAAYYDPALLAPVANAGNQLVFLNFEDRYDPTWTATIGSTTWNVTTTRSNGAGVDATTFTANGVTVSDIASVAGGGVNGSAGSMEFRAPSSNVDLSRMIYFTEALGTFGTGYLLPPLPPSE